MNKSAGAFIILLWTVFAVNSQGQLIKTRLDLLGGVAYPEYVHGGLRYQYTGWGQIELDYGGDMEFRPEIIRSWTLNHMYHFGKKNFLSNRPAWYCRQGYTHITKTTASTIYRQSYLTLSAGYDFPINNWLGVNVDMGVNFRFYQSECYKGEDDPYQIDSRWYAGYLARIQLYISL